MDTAFTASIDAAHGITSGICAADRVRTIQVAVDSGSGPEDVVMPAHVSPLRARPGGVIERGGQTETAVDLARLAGLVPADVICEVMKDDGTMARVPDLEKFSRRHGMKMVIVEYRNDHDRRLRYEGEVDLPMQSGPFSVRTYEDAGEGVVHLALLSACWRREFRPSAELGQYLAFVKLEEALLLGSHLLDVDLVITSVYVLMNSIQVLFGVRSAGEGLRDHLFRHHR